jgi:hypothetical protein
MLFSPVGRRGLSSSALRRSYDDTIKNLRIRADSKVLCQGFTGKTVSPILCFILQGELTNLPGHISRQRGPCLWHQHGRWSVS